MKLKYRREPRLKVKYDKENIGTYQPDFLVEDKMIVEVKATVYFPPSLDKQLVNYLKVTGYRLAIAVNFGQSKLDLHRKVWTHK